MTLKGRILSVAAGLVGTALLLIVLHLASSGVTPANRPKAFDLTVAARVQGDWLLVQGTTTLPDGAIVWLYAWHEDAEADPTLRGLDRSGLATTADGGFSKPLSVAGWPPGKVSVTATFTVGDEVRQPDSVLDIVGIDGDRLVGPKVSVDEFDTRYLTALTSAVIMDR